MVRIQKRFWENISKDKERESVKWNFKTTLKLIVVVAVVGLPLLIIYLPTRDSLDKDNDYYNSETRGVVNSVIQKNGMSQGRNGMHEITLGYEVAYSYIVDGKQYNSVEFVQNSNIDNIQFLGFAKRNLHEENFVVKYVSWKPEDSFIVKDVE